MKHQRRGFSLIELLVVIGIMATIIMASFPGIMNMLATRELENATRDIQASLQVAKFQAVKTKLAHRVLFLQSGDRWDFWIEREATPGNWVKMHGYAVVKIIPLNRFIVTVNLPPTLDIQFNSLGMVANFVARQNSIAIQSLKLTGGDGFDTRTVSFFVGGSIRFEKSKSG